MLLQYIGLGLDKCNLLNALCTSLNTLTTRSKAKGLLMNALHAQSSDCSSSASSSPKSIVVLPAPTPFFATPFLQSDPEYSRRHGHSWNSWMRQKNQWNETFAEVQWIDLQWSARRIPPLSNLCYGKLLPQHTRICSTVRARKCRPHGLWRPLLASKLKCPFDIFKVFGHNGHWILPQIVPSTCIA